MHNNTTQTRMRPVSAFPAADRKAIRYVLTDIDDTLTTDGLLEACAYSAIERLAETGIAVIPITGRPAGWCDHIARMWPVEGVVGENGAMYFRYNREERRMYRQYFRDPAQRSIDREKLSELGEHILREVPGCAIAADQAYREADLAIDFTEDVAPLPIEAIERIQQLFEEAGAHAKISSIHVNGWFGEYDKLTMTKVLFSDVFGIDLENYRDRIVFCGDSPNDAPMFGYFPNSVGVANVRDFVGRIAAEPQWVTEGRGGTGFAELAEHLFAANDFVAND